MLAGGTTALLAPRYLYSQSGRVSVIPSYLKNHATHHGENPRQATLDWFTNARFGLFMQFGVYSVVGLGEWVQYREIIPVAEYAKLQSRFRAERFDADDITDLALSAGMQYVNFTARHHDSFCLFDSGQTGFTSVKSPASRDLIRELAEACQNKGLGLFLYYSYALDWKHPYYYSREASQQGEVQWDAARPDYRHPQPEYKFQDDADFRKYIDFVHNQLRELLTGYGPLAGIWLDPIMGYYSRPDLFPIQETYALIRRLQPQTLICFKQGANGDEVFVAPERHPRAHPSGGSVAQKAWQRNQGKPIEICDTLQPRTWGYDMRNAQEHRTVAEVIEMLSYADNLGANLLLNTGPYYDGSIYDGDAATLREVGRRLRAG